MSNEPPVRLLRQFLFGTAAAAMFTNWLIGEAHPSAKLVAILVQAGIAMGTVLACTVQQILPGIRLRLGSRIVMAVLALLGMMNPIAGYRSHLLGSQDEVFVVSYCLTIFSWLALWTWIAVSGLIPSTRKNSAEHMVDGSRSNGGA